MTEPAGCSMSTLCNQCGAAFISRPSNRERQRFCSSRCRDLWHSRVKDSRAKGGSISRTALWRARLRRRFRGCEVCDFSRVVENAHIIPRRAGGLISKRNLLALCPNHHRLFDHGQLDAREWSRIEHRYISGIGAIDLGDTKKIELLPPLCG